MGELYLDNIDKYLAGTTSGTATVTPPKRPVRVYDEQARIRCTICKQPVRRARIIDGKPYCTVHANEHYEGPERKPWPSMFGPLRR